MSGSSSPPLPRRLLALGDHLRAGKDVFADWQLSRVAPLAKVCPDDEAAIVTEAGGEIVPFAGDFSGGVLALDVSKGDVERSPVLTFDSEGGITVLGDSFDDFLALLAATEPDGSEDSWVASPPLREWILQTGIEPHASATQRLLDLADSTRRFWIEWSAALRAATERVRPAEVVDHLLVLGESQTRVVGVTLFKGRHRAVVADGTAPMFMTATDAMTWLGCLGLVATRDRSAIAVETLGVRFALHTSRGARRAEPWIESVELRAR